MVFEVVDRESASARGSSARYRWAAGTLLSVYLCASQGCSQRASDAPTPASPAAADFTARCTRPGVIRCVGFDDESTIRGRYWTLSRSGITGGVADPTIDRAVFASGGGSLKFTIPSNSDANSSGSFFTNFSDDLSIRFGENQEFFVQWRQRFSRELLTTHYQDGGGWKLAIVGTGDRPLRIFGSCTPLTVVVQSYYQEGFPIVYNSCTGSSSHGPYDGFYEPTGGPGGGDFKLQNARASPHCLYSQKQTTYFAPGGNCFRFFADEWMTFQLRIKTGRRVQDEFVESRVTLWVAREHQPSEMVVDWGPYNLAAGSPDDDQKFGKIWLLPYHTGKNPAQSHAVAHTWYDELIISRNRIDDPLIVDKAN